MEKGGTSCQGDSRQTSSQIRNLEIGDSEAYQPRVEIIEDCQDAKFDIVFVHGLNPMGKASHACDTWTAALSNGEKIFWPKDLLPISIPKVRVMQMVYNSNIAWNASLSGINEHANSLMNCLVLERQGLQNRSRPIIFICHSLGGLLVKQALLLEKPDFQEAINSTRGLVFFATPHRGATGRSVRIGLICAEIVRKVQQEAKNPIPKLLERHSRLADALSRSFAEKRDRFHIISVYETKSMKPYGIIVGKTSAVLEDVPKHEIQIDIDRDHSTVCKFPSADNWGYKQVIGHLKLIMQRIMDSEEESRNSEEELRKNEALRNLEDNPPLDDMEFLQQAAELAFWYEGRRRYEVCERLNEKILERCNNNQDLGAKNPAAVRAAYNRGFALQCLGRFTDSEQMYKRAIEGRQTLANNSDDPSVLKARRQLAEVLYRKSCLTEAEQELNNVLEGWKRTKDDWAILNGQADLAFLFQRLERWKDSEFLLGPAFEAMNKLRSTDEKTLLTQHRYAFVLQSLEDNKKSEDLYRDLLDKRKKENGLVNVDTLFTMRDLAHVLQKKGELSEAEALSETASNGLEKLLPAGHKELEWTYNSLAFIRGKRDKELLRTVTKVVQSAGGTKL